MSGAVRVMSLDAPAVLVRLPYRAFALVVGVGLAYHYSLQTLADGLNLQTPLGYLATVPIIALLVGASTFLTQPRLRSIHDRQLDWIVGLSLVAAAATIDLLLPSAYSTDFWLHRIDLLGLPLFAAGLIAILYGVRRLWSLRWAVLFLFLAWPVPYETVLAGAIGASTDATLAVVEAISRVLPIAQPVGEGTFLVSHAGSAFSLSVGSACSGINSLVGFLIMGTAWNAVLKGGLVRRVVWLAAGLALVGALNVVRIELIFAAGALLGAPFALDVLHPVAGLVVFAIGALLMFGLAGPLGLEIAPRRRDDPLAGPSGGSAVAPDARRWRLLAPAGVALLLAGILALPDGSFDHYDNLVGAFGQPVLGAIDPSAVTLAGWTSSPSISNAQATQYFGPHATWERVAFTADVPTSGPGTTYLDVIRTDDAASFGAYGVEACYSFHGYRQVTSRSLDVGAGVDARLVSYHSPDGETDWSVLWWEWPYDGGGETRFERLVLLAPVDTGSFPASQDVAFGQAEATLTHSAKTLVAQAMARQADPTAVGQP